MQDAPGAGIESIAAMHHATVVPHHDVTALPLVCEREIRFDDEKDHIQQYQFCHRKDLLIQLTFLELWFFRLH